VKIWRAGGCDGCAPMQVQLPKGCLSREMKGGIAGSLMMRRGGTKTVRGLMGARDI
jgi:hypothetical protein